MLAVERRNRIEQIINKNKSVLVVELAKQFEVTTETIRGDLEKLEKQGVLVRTYGGATLVDNSEIELAITERDTVNYEGKQRIGKYAADLIKDGETIFLDASTSAWHLARYIKGKRGITVITNALKAGHSFQTAMGNIAVDMEGPMAEEFGRVTRETQRGMTLEASFNSLCERIGRTDHFRQRSGYRSAGKLSGQGPEGVVRDEKRRAG